MVQWPTYIRASERKAEQPLVKTQGQGGKTGGGNKAEKKEYLARILNNHVTVVSLRRFDLQNAQRFPLHLVIAIEILCTLKLLNGSFKYTPRMVLLLLFALHHFQRAVPLTRNTSDCAPSPHLLPLPAILFMRFQLSVVYNRVHVRT